MLNVPGSTNPARGSIDLDDYSRGFGTWSGTSFAAPALAGDIAAYLVANGGGRALATAGFPARVEKANEAVRAVLEMEP
jgi:subtilisin family serine protease